MQWQGTPLALGLFEVKTSQGEGDTFVVELEDKRTGVKYKTECVMKDLDDFNSRTVGGVLYHVNKALKQDQDHSAAVVLQVCCVDSHRLASLPVQSDGSLRLHVKTPLMMDGGRHEFVLKAVNADAAVAATSCTDIERVAVLERQVAMLTSLLTQYDAFRDSNNKEIDGCCCSNLVRSEINTGGVPSDLTIGTKNDSMASSS